MKKVKLITIASARSGDKNNVCNIGLMSKKPERTGNYRKSKGAFWFFNSR
jgi:hypothetical protein